MNQPVDPPCLLCTYTQVFMFEHHCGMEKEPWCASKCDVTSWTSCFYAQ